MADAEQTPDDQQAQWEDRTTGHRCTRQVYPTGGPDTNSDSVTPRAAVTPTAIDWRPILVRVATAAALAILVWRWWLIVSVGHEWDAGAYWWADPFDPYPRGDVNTSRAYLYSPAFAQVISPLTALPWTAFHVAWTTINFGALVFLLGPIGAAIASVIPPVADELMIGNIHLLIGAAIVLGFRYPAAWAFPLLTKVTPGIGVLWFAFRAEWRSLAIAAAATGLAVGVSFLVAPAAWGDWVAVLAGNTAARVEVDLLPVPLLVKLATAVAIVAVAARFDRRWLVPFAAFLALPVNWFPSLSVLLASFPLIQDDARRRRASVTPSPSPHGETS